MLTPELALVGLTQLIQVWPEGRESDFVKAVAEIVARRHVVVKNEPYAHFAEHGEPGDHLLHSDWLKAGDRTKEWFNIPGYIKEK